MAIKALFFDVFGTVLDWRGSVIERSQQIFHENGVVGDAAALADLWRAAYLPAIEAIMSGRREWVDIDQLHYENLEQVLAELGIVLPTQARLELNRTWHRLQPWIDSRRAIARLKQRYIVAPVSNASFEMMVNLSRHARLSWDIILSAELARSYKPDPKVYLAAAAALRLDPAECLMVAAHNIDLDAARTLGFQTAFILRSTEFGPGQTTDLSPHPDCTMAASDLDDLANQLFDDDAVLMPDVEAT
jgi:2-haloacid dehalogenase